MPTPVQHLVVAEAVLAHPRLPEAVRARLRAERAAFLFGNTAPDAQTISGQPRADTHFFHVPLDSDRPAHEAMFQAYPALARPERLPLVRAAFLAGYIAHLLLDVMWVRDIFMPVFGPDATWGHFRERLFLHNVLRAWCDRHDQTRLPPSMAPTLATVSPDGWLPFLDDRPLCQWRDLLAGQFQPGATIRTVEVFAERGRVEPEDFERALSSEDYLDEMIFSRLSRTAVDDLYVRGLDESCRAIAEYLGRLGA